MFTDWLRRQKDSSTSFVLERVLQNVLGKYGRMLNFYIDSKQKTAQIEMLLNGEKEPLSIIVQEYELLDESGETYFIVKKATASREWVQVLVNDFLVGHKFAVPQKYVGMVRMVA